MPSAGKLLLLFLVLLVLLCLMRSDSNEYSSRWSEAWCILGYRVISSEGTLVYEEWGDSLGVLQSHYCRARIANDIGEDIAMQTQMYIMVRKTTELWERVKPQVSNSVTCSFEATYLYFTCIERKTDVLLRTGQSGAISGLVTCTQKAGNERSYSFRNFDTSQEYSVFKLSPIAGNNAYASIDYEDNLDLYHLALDDCGIPRSIGCNPIGRVIRLDEE